MALVGLIVLMIALGLGLGFSGFLKELQKDDNGDKMSPTNAGYLLPFTIGLSGVIRSIVYCI